MITLALVGSPLGEWTNRDGFYFYVRLAAMIELAISGQLTD